MIERLRTRSEPWDLVVIGGGSTGVGVALDAASRGWAVALLEQSDFGKGTSSRSTKLVHGGVRYLRQGNVPLVMEALKERGILRRNAPHLVHELPFVVPNYAWWETPFYGIGMKVYDALAGRYGFGRSANLSLEETVAQIPTIETEGLRGGVLYHDGQFDDARLLLNMVTTAAEQGAVVANYVRVTGVGKDAEGFVSGVRALDTEAGVELGLDARVVVNATGPFSDEVRRMDEPEAPGVMRPSQGVHLVLDRSFLPGNAAIMVPQTDDGRVLFAIPWLDRVLVGTTDTPIEEVTLEPEARQEEIEFLLGHAARYLTRDPGPEDVRSVFVGIRPLVGSEEDVTSEIARDHTILISDSGLLTVAGGKWTTYRRIAEDVVEHAAGLGGLDPGECVTERLNIHGFHERPERFGELAAYGSDAVALGDLIDEEPGMERRLHERLPIRAGEVAWAARREMARTVDDVLARRTRSLLLDARAAREAAPAVARVLARELERDDAWADGQVTAFEDVARRYVLE